MIWHLIAVVIAGLSVGGMLFLLRKLSKDRLPKWLVSASAGAAMLAYLAYYDYTWYDFKRSRLPSDSLLIDTQSPSSFLRPWSYVSAPVNAFTVFDGRSRRHEQDGETLIQYILYTFRKDPLERLDTRAYLLNCTRMERALFDRDAPDDRIGLEKISRDDPMYQTLCLHGRKEPAHTAQPRTDASCTSN
jgi:hypothetical protein